MKNTLFILVFICLSVAASAQLKLGLQAGYSWTKLLDKANPTESEFGASAGIVSDIFLNDLFSLQPTILFSQKGFEQEVGNSRFTYSYNQIEVPVHLTLKFGLSTRFCVIGGPYFAYSLNGRLIEDIQATKTQIKDYGEYNLRVGTKTNDHLKPIDMGGSLGAYVVWESGLFAKLNGRYGFLNLRPDQNSTALNTFAIGAAVGWFITQ